MLADWTVVPFGLACFLWGVLVGCALAARLIAERRTANAPAAGITVEIGFGGAVSHGLHFDFANGVVTDDAGRIVGNLEAISGDDQPEPEASTEIPDAFRRMDES